MIVWFLGKIKGKSYQNVSMHRLCGLVLNHLRSPVVRGTAPIHFPLSEEPPAPRCSSSLPLLRHCLPFFHHSGLFPGEIFPQLFYLFSFYFAIVACACFGSLYIETLFFFCKNESRCKRHTHKKTTLHKTAKQLKCG